MKGLAGLIFLVLGLAVTANATTITYETSNISGNRWQYMYSIANDTPLPSLKEFTVYFDYALYANLSLVNSPSGWDPLVVQPDTILDAEQDGYYDAYSLAGLMMGNAVTGFMVEFDWLGSPSGPGVQAFEVINPDNFSMIESGTSVLAQDSNAPIPEPSTVLLTALGLAGFVLSRRKRNHEEKL